jgi:hypothetical protein
MSLQQQTKSMLKAQFGGEGAAKDILKSTFGTTDPTSALLGKPTTTTTSTRRSIGGGSYLSGPKDYSTFDVDQSRDNITAQLKHQFDFYNQRGMKYQHQKDMPFITEQMAKHLSEAGIKDLRQLGRKATTTETTLVKQGDKYFKKVATSSYNAPTTTKLVEVSADKLSNIREEEIDRKVQVRGYHGGYDANAYKTVKEKVIKADMESGYDLINKETGEKVVQGKYGGTLTAYGEGQGYRWGNTTRTEGMTDFMIDFDKDGNALIFPRYQDTATDLSGIMTVASVALAATGAGAGLGAALTKGAGTALTQQMIGNTIINATMTSLTGGDVFKSVLSSVAMPVISNGLDTALGNTIFADLPVTSSTRNIIGATMKSSVLSGVNAAIMGQDIGDAMFRGAVSGGAGQGMQEFSQAFFTEDKLSFITDNTNLKYKEVQGLLNLGMRQGVANVLDGRDFFEGMKTTLVSHGVSTSIANKVTDGIRGDVGDETLATVRKLSKNLSDLYIRSSMTGQPVTPEHIQQIIIKEALTSAGRASGRREAREKKEDSTISIDDNSRSYLESLS